MIHLQALIDDAKCFATVRALRWPDGVRCPTCDGAALTKQGRADTQPERQRSLWKSCERRFDDWTDTIFADHHQPLRVWILCLYCLGLTLSHHHMASALDRHPSAVHQMPCPLRQGIVPTKPTPTFSDVVECDEVSSIAGHKGPPDKGEKKGGADGVDGSRARVDAAPLPKRSPRSSG
jgi:hypothetical protein